MGLLVCAAAPALLALPLRWRTVAVAMILLELALERGLHTALLLVGIAGTGSDPNLALKVEKGIRFIADDLTWEKSLVALAVLLTWLTLGWRLVHLVSTPPDAS